MFYEVAFASLYVMPTLIQVFHWFTTIKFQVKTNQDPYPTVQLYLQDSASVFIAGVSQDCSICICLAQSRKKEYLV